MSTNTYDVDVAPAPRHGPSAVIGLMAELAEAAQAENVQIVHPADVVLTSGRARLAPGVRRTEQPENLVTLAPESARTGPTPATLAYSLGAIGALSALGTLDPGPPESEPHRVWVDWVVDRLEKHWAGVEGAELAIDWIARALAFDPASRPDPRGIPHPVSREARVRRTPAPVPGTGVRTVGAILTTNVEGNALVPYAMLTAVLAGLALAAALCTLGAVMGRWVDRLSGGDPPTVVAPAPVAPAPPARVVEFRDEPPLVVPPAEVEAVAVRPGPGVAPPPTTPEPAVEVAPKSAPTGPDPVPRHREPDPPDHKPVPGNDLRDPWNR